MPTLRVFSSALLNLCTGLTHYVLERRLDYVLGQLLYVLPDPPMHGGHHTRDYPLPVLLNGPDHQNLQLLRRERAKVPQALCVAGHDGFCGAAVSVHHPHRVPDPLPC